MISILGAITWISRSAVITPISADVSRTGDKSEAIRQLLAAFALYSCTQILRARERAKLAMLSKDVVPWAAMLYVALTSYRTSAAANETSVIWEAGGILPPRKRRQAETAITDRRPQYGAYT